MQWGEQACNYCPRRNAGQAWSPENMKNPVQSLSQRLLVSLSKKGSHAQSPDSRWNPVPDPGEYSPWYRRGSYSRTCAPPSPTSRQWGYMGSLDSSNQPRKPHTPHKNSQRSIKADATPSAKSSTSDFGVDPIPHLSPVAADWHVFVRRAVSTTILQSKVANLIAKGDEFGYINAALFRDAIVEGAVPYDWATAGGGGELPCDV